MSSKEKADKLQRLVCGIISRLARLRQKKYASDTFI